MNDQKKMNVRRFLLAKLVVIATLGFPTLLIADVTITPVGDPINLDSSLVGCEDESEACVEMSGLSISHQKNSMWTIDDHNDWGMYKMQFNGDPSTGTDGSFMATQGPGANEIEEPSFEGVTYACVSGEDCDNSHYIYVVDEERNSIIPVEYHEQVYGNDKKIAKMKNADQMLPSADAFCGACRGKSLSDCLDGAGNSGLEGITFSPVHNSFFVLKEKKPGLLMKISADLEEVEQVWGLGLGDSCGDKIDIDYSGLAYDPTRCASTEQCEMWLVSDEAESVYLLDVSDTEINNRDVIASDSIRTSHALGHKCSEGVAYNDETNNLYVVVDGGKGASECKIPGNHSYLYIYEVGAE